MGHLYLRMFGTNCVEALFSTCRQLSRDNEQVRVVDLSLAFGLMDRLVCFSDLIRKAKRSYLYPEEDEEGEDD